MIDGTIIGYIIHNVLNYDHDGNGILIIAKLLAIHPDHRKKGHGRYIMKEWEKEIRRLYCSKIKSANSSNMVTILLHDASGVGGFYWRLGYSNIEKCTASEKHKYDMIIRKGEKKEDDVIIEEIFIKKLCVELDYYC